MIPLIIAAVLLAVPAAYAQIDLGRDAAQERVEVGIDGEGLVRVMHTVKPSSSPAQLDLLEGAVGNLTVRDAAGNERPPVRIGGGGLLITPSDRATVVEYDLSGAVRMVDGYWRWEFSYPQSVLFVLPDGIEWFYQNDRVRHADGAPKLLCHGCTMTLEYSPDEPVVRGSAAWEDREFAVGIITHSEVGGPVFDQPSKSLAVQVPGDGRFVTAVIPTELLGGPYIVLLDDRRIYAHESASNDTHAWVSVRPHDPGQLTIIGTTVIPEFATLLPLLAGIMIMIAVPLAARSGRLALTPR